MKKCFVFVLTLMIVFGSASAVTAKADDGSYYSMEQVLEYYRFSWDSSFNDFVSGSIAEQYPYFLVYRVNNPDGIMGEVIYYAARCSAVPVSFDTIIGSTQINLYDADGNIITFSNIKSTVYNAYDNLSDVHFSISENSDMVSTGSDYDVIYYSNFDDSFLERSFFVLAEDIYIADDGVYWIQGNTEGIVDVTATILQLLKTFPLNVIVVGWVTVICVGNFRLLKLSIK